MLKLSALTILLTLLLLPGYYAQKEVYANELSIGGQYHRKYISYHRVLDKFNLGVSFGSNNYPVLEYTSRVIFGVSQTGSIPVSFSGDARPVDFDSSGVNFIYSQYNTVERDVRINCVYKKQLGRLNAFIGGELILGIFNLSEANVQTKWSYSEDDNYMSITEYEFVGINSLQYNKVGISPTVGVCIDLLDRLKLRLSYSPEISTLLARHSLVPRSMPRPKKLFRFSPKDQTALSLAFSF